MAQKRGYNGDARSVLKEICDVLASGKQGPMLASLLCPLIQEALSRAD